MSGELPDFIRFGRSICGDLEQAERREWWLSNGLGAYAAGTVAGTLTRCYHGLLIAPVYPPLGRWLTFAKADATLLDGGQEIPLFSNRWGGGVAHPQGHIHLESFQLQGRLPVWRFALGERIIEQRIWLEPGANTVYTAWRLDTSAAGCELQLRVRLLINARDHHARMAPGGFTPQVNMTGEQLHVVCPDQFALRLLAAGGALQPDWDWIENFDLPLERERGLPDRDANLCIGHALLTLRPGIWVGITASLHDDASADLDAALHRILEREAALLDRAQADGLANAPDWIAQLALAADSFLFARPLPD